MATENVTRGVLLVVSEEIGSAATKVLTASGVVRVKAVTGPRAALAAFGQFTTHFLVFEAGRVPVPAMQAVKNMAELTAGRSVPVVMVCGPLDESVDSLKETLGIVEVLDEPYQSAALLETLKGLIEKIEKAREESRLRRNKQQQIRERLRTASNKYAAMSEEAAAQHLEQARIEQEEAERAAKEKQDFASDDIAPPTDPNSRPPDSPTWDGSGGGE